MHFICTTADACQYIASAFKNQLIDYLKAQTGWELEHRTPDWMKIEES